MKQVLEKLNQADRLKNISNRLIERVGIDYRYRTLAIREKVEVEQFKKEEQLELSKDLNNSDPSLSLNKESIELLSRHRPLNVSI